VNKELIIHTSEGSTDVAILEDKVLTELHQERVTNQFNVGDVYLGRIKKVMPGLNAAFIDVGYEKDAFIHYTDLSPSLRSLMKYTAHAVAGSNDGTLNNFTLEPEIIKTGNVKEVLSGKQFLLVQILKEPISTKGPRLTCEISIAGRYLVLTPFNDTVGVSKKIDSAEERKRLRVLVEGLKPKNFGVIVRTQAAGKDTATLHQDLNMLVEKWKEMSQNLRNAQPAKKVLSEVDKTTGILRDLLNPDFNKVVTNNVTLTRELEDYIARIAPDRKGMVSTYNGKQPIFDYYGITKQIKSSFGRTVNMPNGSYLIIEKTEALHVVDVNSGHRNTNEGTQEKNALSTNIEAAKEIARQLRLRDLGGIIVIDFIDMKVAEHKQELFTQMREFMEIDRATHTILPLSRFNIMQITRERVRPEINIVTTEVCPTCAGSGAIQSSLLLLDEIEADLLTLTQAHRSLKLYVHPIVEAYLKKGFPSIRLKWWWKFKSYIKIYSNESLSFTDYKLFDEHEEEIKLD
jgi:ribonuclease G